MNDPLMLFCVFLVLMLFVREVLERAGVPAVFALVVAGAILGPHGLNWLTPEHGFLVLGSAVGAVYLLFTAGVEIDPKQFRRNLRRSVVLGLLTFGLPLAGGVAVAAWLGYPFWSALLIGSLFSSHTLLSYPQVSKLGLAKNDVISTAVGATIVTDVLAIMVTAVCLAASKGHNLATTVPALVIPFVALSLLVVLGLPRLARSLIEHVKQRHPTDVYFVLGVLFLVALLCSAMGLPGMIGAFLVGLAVSSSLTEDEELLHGILFLGRVLFVPLFLLDVGMELNPARALGTGSNLFVVMVVVGMLIATKAAAGFLSAWLFRIGVDQAVLMVLLTLPQAAVTLVQARVGLEAGMLRAEFVDAVILLSMTTCLAPPFLFEALARRMIRSGRLTPHSASNTGSA